MSAGREAVEEFLCDTAEKGLGFRVKGLDEEKIKNRSEAKM